MVIGLLGILKAGAAYLPLDPHYPRERLSFMLADAGAAVLVTQSGLLDRLPETAAHTHIVRLDTDWPAIARQPATAPQPDLDPRHPAYVIYTSGSTGMPKGVVVSHEALSNFLGSMAEQVPLKPHDRLLAVTTIGFDIAALELYLPLLAGASIAIAPRLAGSGRAAPPSCRRRRRCGRRCSPTAATNCRTSRAWPCSRAASRCRASLRVRLQPVAAR
jgi:non-ribosomal peptide synthetase component F